MSDQITIRATIGTQGLGLIWDRVKTFDNSQHAAAYVYRMGKLYGDAFVWWLR